MKFDCKSGGGRDKRFNYLVNQANYIDTIYIAKYLDHIQYNTPFLLTGKCIRNSELSPSLIFNLNTRHKERYGRV